MFIRGQKSQTVIVILPLLDAAGERGHGEDQEVPADADQLQRGDLGGSGCRRQTQRHEPRHWIHLRAGVPQTAAGAHHYLV